MARSLAVVGGGVIGLSVAWRAAQCGWSVRVHDSASGSGASRVAGGMLAPLSEGWPGEDAVLALGAASLERWPDFGKELEVGADLSLFTSTSSLTVALDGADVGDLRTIADWVGAQGYDMEILDRQQVRELEPALGPKVRLGLLAHSELAVDNRLLLRALRENALAAGVEFVTENVRDLDSVEADQIVLASGRAAPSLWPSLPVRAVKGEILRLGTRPGVTPAPGRTIRGTVHGRPAYLVPRADGIVLGATQYESGEDTQVTVSGVRNLIADAEALMPAIGEYELKEAAAGLRPMTPDNLPLIGRVSDRVVVAAGHGRNGILLTPVTADAVVALLNGDALVEAQSANPERFGERSEVWR
ncbi:glycine oxidase ThiO [Rhodococcus sp. NPDC058521]|uniref:glycine oxidase ThiO n=1 Tax=Rhodococcus sp. NPDC058521 TaxID=3346536 RepID=UPI0036674E93